MRQQLSGTLTLYLSRAPALVHSFASALELVGCRVNRGIIRVRLSHPKQ